MTTDKQEALWPEGRSQDTEAKETVGGGQGAGVGTWSTGVKYLDSPGQFQSQSQDSGVYSTKTRLSSNGGLYTDTELSISQSQAVSNRGQRVGG